MEDGELAEALAWLQAQAGDSDGSDAEGEAGGLSELAAQVALLTPGARSTQQVCVKLACKSPSSRFMLLVQAPRTGLLWVAVFSCSTYLSIAAAALS